MSFPSCFCVCVCNIFLIFFSFLFFFFFGIFWSSLLHGLFSSCSEHGLLSSCGAQASHCSGSSCGAGFLGTRASVVVARGLENTGCVPVMHRLSCYVGSSHIKDWNCVSSIGRQILYCWATREALCVQSSNYLCSASVFGPFSSSA